MVNHICACPYCGQKKRVVRCSFNRGGTQRLLCKECGKMWTPHGKSRTLSKRKEALIEKALQERLSQRAIARTLSVSRDTVRAVLKRVRAAHLSFGDLLLPAISSNGGGRVGDSLQVQAALSLFVAGGFPHQPSGRRLLHWRSQHSNLESVLALFAW